MLFSELKTDEIKYIKIIYLNTQNKNVEVIAQRETISENKILLAINFEADFPNEYPSAITLKFATDRGLFLAYTTIKSASSANTQIYLDIAVPEAIEKYQNREFYRILVKRPMIIKFLDEEQHFQQLVSYTADVSIGGVRTLAVKNSLSGSNLTFSFDKCSHFVISIKIDDNTVFVSNAKFVRKCTDRNAVLGFAFKFENTTNQNINMISKFIANEQLLQRKKLM